jgi:hypothetical protein
LLLEGAIEKRACLVEVPEGRVELGVGGERIRIARKEIALGHGRLLRRHARARSQEERRDRPAALALAAWRDTPYFTDAERAALALTEATTRLQDSADAVPDAVWNEAARHYEEPALAALVLNIALINFWNRTNVPTRQVAGTGF